MRPRPRTRTPPPARREPTRPSADGTRRRIAFARLRDLALIPAIIVIGVVGQFVSPVFLQPDNIINILQTMSEIAILVLAQTMVLIVKRWTSRSSPPWGWRPGSPPGSPSPPGRATVSASFRVPGRFPSPSPSVCWWAPPTRCLIIRFGLNGFIVTLGMLIVLRGILTGISGGQTFFQLPESMMYLGTTQWLGVPASIWICLALFAIGIVVLGFTGFGRSLTPSAAT